jgi:hypothetical protein
MTQQNITYMLMSLWLSLLNGVSSIIPVGTGEFDPSEQELDCWPISGITIKAMGKERHM